MRLFLKSNRVMETDDRITVILVYLRGGVAGIYIQRKLNKLDKETRNQNPGLGRICLEDQDYVQCKGSRY